MTLLVHLHRPPAEEYLAQLKDYLDPAIELTLGPTLPDPACYRILVAGRPERAHLTASPELAAVIVPWAGIPEETRALAREEFPDLPVHNLHHNAVPVAEGTVALLLAAAKGMLPADRALREHDWRPRYQREQSLLLNGRTVLILGYGAIGRRVAQACHALGMRVLATRRHPDRPVPEAFVEMHASQALQELLPRADALIICLPLTPETEGLIGAEELALLPTSAVLVNIARGSIVDQAALYQALNQGTLQAAGLDVWYHYPSRKDERTRADTAPADYPFHELENVVMSPHRAGGTDGTEGLRMQHLATLLNAAARGEEVPNRVDLEAGY
jgi:phosphoglycerate dehydrogenase-like enzyme